MKRFHHITVLCIIVALLVGCGNLTRLLSQQNTKTSSASNETLLTVAFLDVGQGDSTFIRFPNGKTALIDAGDAGASQTITQHIQNSGTQKIDYLIATHPHADHIGSMQQVVDRFEIGEIYMPRVSHNSKTYEKLLLAIQNKGLTIHTARAGVTIEVEPNITLAFIAPCSKSYEDKNNYSAVVRLLYDNTAFLFTGDAEVLSEQEMINSGTPLSADVLKVGHHGSKSSTDAIFLQAVQPQYAVISVGADNSYSHPHQVTLKKLAEIGATIFRTDINGTITAVSDGKNIQITGEQ